MKAVLIVALAAAVTAAAPADAQSRQSLVQRLDSIAGADVAASRAVGLAAAVVKGSDTLLMKGYGKADVEGDVPAAPDVVFPIASVTKQFTAVAILQLRDKGKLSLDDDITRWLPDFNTRGNRVTLRNMLDHTSGIAELTDMRELHAMQLMRNPSVTRDTVYKIINSYPFQFPTGTMEIYSNSNFWLLGLVIEKASGMSYEDYVETNIFAPLGMKRSMYCNNADDVPRRAFGYGMRNGSARRAPSIVQTGTYAAGALCSTAGDMVKWLQALHGGKVLSATSYKELITPGRLNDGTPLRYSMGLTVGEDGNGLRFIGHDGGGFGFSSEARWYPDARLAVVTLTNSEPDELAVVTDALAAAVLPASRVAGPFKGDVSLLAGKYKGTGSSGEMVVDVTPSARGIAVSVDGGPASPLEWVAGLSFRRDGSLLTFRRVGTQGGAKELHFDTGGDHFILRRQ